MRTPWLVLVAILVLAGVGTAQGFITTTFTSNNGGSANWMNMFILRVDNPAGINITSLAVNCSGTVKTTFSVDVYTTAKTYVGNEYAASVWKKVSTGSSLVVGKDMPNPVDVSDFILPPGQYGIAIHYINTGMSYTNGTGTGPTGNQRYSNSDLAMQCGCSITSLFGGGQNTPRVWNGTIWYQPAVTAILSGSGAGTPNSTYNYSLLVASRPKAVYRMASALGNGPIPIDNRKLGLSLDSLLVASAGGTLPTIFSGYVGALDSSGRASAKLNLPNIPQLKGLTIYTAFVTMSATSPSGVSDISNTVDFKIG